MATRSGMLQMGFLALCIWLITADPVEKLLPVPMPKLVAGPDTTRMDGVIIRDGVPDFASVIDVRDHARLTGPHNLFGPIAAAVGIDRWSAAEQTMAEPWLLGRKPLASAPIYNKNKTLEATSDDAKSDAPSPFATTSEETVWLTACASALTALRLLPVGELAIPMALSQSSDARKTPTAGNFIVFGLVNLGNAELATSLSAAHAGDVHALKEVTTLITRISSWLVDTRQTFAFAEALQLQGKLRDTWLTALSEHGNPDLHAAISEWNSALPTYDPRSIFDEGLRLSQVRMVAQFCEQFRNQKSPSDSATNIRRNAPPDPNIAVNEVQMACDAADQVLGACGDIASLGALDEKKLPQFRELVEESFDQRPLAERMLFRNPIGLRRAFVAKRFASLAIIDMQLQQKRVIGRAKALIRRSAAVNVALGIREHHARTGALPNSASDLPASLQSTFVAGDTAITLTCTTTDCTIATAGDKPVTLWHFTISPPATTP